MAEGLTLTEAEVLALIKTRVAALGGVKDAASHWGVHKQSVYMVLYGQRGPSRVILDDLGIEAEVVPQHTVYRRKA